VRLVPIPVDADGRVVEAMPDALRAARARGGRVRLLYTVPTYNNPTGMSLADGRCRALVALAEREDFLVLEDAAYRELASDDPAAPPSLWSIAAPGTVIRLGLFSKSLAPGLRVGYLTADPATVTRFADGGVLDSGGGISHFAALAVAEFARSGEFAANVARLRDALRERRDALVDGLAAAMPDGTTWLTPRGGYFVWVTLPPGRSARALLPIAEAAGTSFVPGSAFHVRTRGEGEGDPAVTGAADDGEAERSLRLSFSRFPPDRLREAARRLGRAAGRAPLPDEIRG
jgi:DNA-binding transcriptional MocR family regulator